MTLAGWYMAAWSDELGPRPLGRRLGGHPYVLFRDARGAATALSAICPHRGGDLASGELREGCVRCPYHGWELDGDGRCVRIPSQPAHAGIPPRARARKLTAVESDGAVWVWLTEGPPVGAPPPLRLPGTPRRRLRARPQRFDAGFVDVVEQAIDSSHHPFVHRGAMGARQPTEVPPIRVDVDEAASALEWEYERAPPGAPETPRHLLGALRDAALDLSPPTTWRYRSDLPGLLQLHIAYRSGGWELSALAFTPRDAGSTWVFAQSARTRAPHLLGDLHQRYFMLRVLDEDRRAMRLLIGPRPAEGFPTAVSARADAATLAFRRLYARALQNGQGGSSPHA